MQPQYIINTVFSSCTYWFPVCDGVVCMVDAGDVDRALSVIPEGTKVAALLLTHVHFDHIYGVPRLLELYPDCLIITNEAGKEALGDERRNMSKYHGAPISVTSGNISIVHDNDTINIGGRTVTVYETPGHNPSCICYAVDDCLFTGDAHIPGVKVVTTLPGGDKVLAKGSEDRIMQLSEGRIIFPGHRI